MGVFIGITLGLVIVIYIMMLSVDTQVREIKRILQKRAKEAEHD